MQGRNPSQIRNLEALQDADLVRMALKRDEGAFRIIMQRHNRRLYRCVRCIVRDDNEAEDIVQQAYVNAFSNLATFRGDPSLVTGSHASPSTKHWRACDAGGQHSSWLHWTPTSMPKLRSFCSR